MPGILTFPVQFLAVTLGGPSITMPALFLAAVYCLIFGLGAYVAYSQRQLIATLRELRQESARNKTLLESLEEGIIALDKDGIVQYMNPAAFKLLDMSDKVQVLIGKNLSEALPLLRSNGTPVTTLASPATLALQSGKVATTDEYYYARPDRSLLPVSVTVAPLYGDKGIIGAVQTFRDISETKEIEDAKNEVISLASHQLRTPLSAIAWYGEMLLNGDAGKLSEEQHDYINEIYQGNKRMIELINDLLDVSRIDLGKFIIDPKPTDISAVGAQAIKDVHIETMKKDINIHEEYDPTIPKDLQLDPKLVHIIFHNFLTNAIKYTPSKGDVALRIKRVEYQGDLPISSWAGSGESILISVSDTGYGIPAHQQDKVFSKLFRADNVRTLDVPSNGLGLYIVKEIIDEVGGKVWFESEENKGTTFYVNLPITGMQPRAGNRHIGEAPTD